MSWNDTTVNHPSKMQANFVQFSKSTLLGRRRESKQTIIINCIHYLHLKVRKMELVVNKRGFYYKHNLFFFCIQDWEIVRVNTKCLCVLSVNVIKISFSWTIITTNSLLYASGKIHYYFLCYFMNTLLGSHQYLSDP